MGATHKAEIEPVLTSMRGLVTMLGVGAGTVGKLVKQGEIETVLIGSKRLAFVASAKAYVERLRAAQKRAA
jgi:hypothetical protein